MSNFGMASLLREGEPYLYDSPSRHRLLTGRRTFAFGRRRGFPSTALGALGRTLQCLNCDTCQLLNLLEELDELIHVPALLGFGVAGASHVAHRAVAQRQTGIDVLGEPVLVVVGAVRGEPLGRRLERVGTGQRVGLGRDTHLGASRGDLLRDVGERVTDDREVVDSVGQEQRNHSLGELVDDPAVVREVLHVLGPLEPGATVLLATIAEVLVGLDRVLVRGQSDDLAQRALGSCGGGDRIDDQVRIGEDLGEELRVDLHELPRTLEGAEVAAGLRARDVAVLVQLEGGLGTGTLVDERVDEHELEGAGDEQEALVVPEVAVEPVVREQQRERVEGRQRIGVVQEHALDRGERGLDLVVGVLAGLSDPGVVGRVARAGDAVGTRGGRGRGVGGSPGNELAGHVTGDRGEQAVLVVVAQNRGLHLAAGVLLHDVLDRRVAELLVEHREAEAAVAAHGVGAPLDRGHTVLPLGRVLGTRVVVRADAAEVGVDDVVVHADVGHPDAACHRVRLDLAAGEHASHRAGDAKVRGQSDLVVGQAVLLDWCDHVAASCWLVPDGQALAGSTLVGGATRVD